MTFQAVDHLSVKTLRFLAVDAVEKAASGHPGTPMEAAPLAYVLWSRILRHNPANPAWVNRDRFILFCGHASMLLYGLLHLTGYPLSLDDVKAFRQWGSLTPGHPEFGHTAGVETTTGPLGQGFATGVGMALAERFLAARYNRPGLPLVDYLTYAFVSDGDVMEGISSEAASLAGHLKLSKLKYVYLDNRITIEGKTDLAFTEDVARRFEAFGWDVTRLDDVENLDAVHKAFRRLRTQTEKPSLLIARTHIGFGSPKKQDTAEAHGAPLGADEAKATKQNLGWPLDPTFHVPPEVSAHAASFRARGADEEKAWTLLWEAYRRAHPDLAAEFESLGTSPLPKGWEASLPSFTPADALATRQSSGKVLNAVAKVLPTLIGGSADLAPSNNSAISGGGDFSAENPAGRNIHFGIREHAMGAILNGMAVTGRLIPYGATFLTFADYMRPSIRLAALMNLGVIYVFTHDSLAVGEDGPTHQPVEHLLSLRAIPQLAVIRPADAAETAEAWRVALERRRAPTALILSRQKVAAIDRARFAPASGLARGAYTLTVGVAAPDVLLLASGSEVGLALAAAEALTAEGHRPAVISFPSWELFDAQAAAYRDEVLPPSVKARVVVEAGRTIGWHKYAGPAGRFVTVDRFGASAPGDVVMEKFGFTVDSVRRAAHEALAAAQSLS
jgi:transketolase